mmetsp:Transcript_30886/g.75401  ORF Transcript_30886/g.75401 Transcript_30886/m.75401 type:complete len:218 (+) Transcript_30886:445-1098(+)
MASAKCDLALFRLMPSLISASADSALSLEALARSLSALSWASSAPPSRLYSAISLCADLNFSLVASTNCCKLFVSILRCSSNLCLSRLRVPISWSFCSIFSNTSRASPCMLTFCSPSDLILATRIASLFSAASFPAALSSATALCSDVHLPACCSITLYACPIASSLDFSTTRDLSRISSRCRKAAWPLLSSSLRAPSTCCTICNFMLVLWASYCAS